MAERTEADSPLVDLLEITARLERRTVYPHEAWIVALWRTMASILEDRGGRHLPDEHLCIADRLGPIVGIAPCRQMALAN